MTAASLLHQCPRTGCTAWIGEDDVACDTHWPQVPRQLRRAVWRTMCRAGAGSDEHTAAVAAAVAALNRRPAP
jgi:hypothetical protein